MRIDHRKKQRMNDPATSSLNDQLSLLIDRDATYHEVSAWVKELEMMGFQNVSKVINYSDVQHPIDELTAMLQAAEKGNLGIVRCLVQHGGDVDLSRVNLGLTAFAWACYRDHLAVVKYLVENCLVNVDAHTPAGRTALLWACRRGNLDMVRFLVEVAHVKVYHKEGNMITPLLLISTLAHVDEGRYLRIIQYLVEFCGVNVNDQDINGYTALINARLYLTLSDISAMLLSRYGTMDIIRYLVEDCQADLRLQTKLNFSALTVTSFIQVQQYLISKGAVS